MLRIATIAVAATVAAGPHSGLFKPGYNLCHAANLSAIRAAGGQPYKAGIFANKACLWERSDLKAGVSLSTHPRAIGLALLRQFLAEKSTFKTTRVRVAGATSAVITTVPQSLSTTPAKQLLAVYPNGAVQINMNAPKRVADNRLFAVVAVVR